MSKQVSQAEYARMKEVSRAAVSKWVSKGLIELDPETGKIDPVDADARLEANRDTSKVRSKPGAQKAREPKTNDGDKAKPESTLTKARTQREIIQAQKAKVELDHLQGTLVSRQDVEDSVFEIIRIFRDQLQGMPAKLAPRLAIVSTPQECAQILGEEMDLIQKEMFRKLQEVSVNAGSSS